MYSSARNFLKQYIPIIPNNTSAWSPGNYFAYVWQSVPFRTCVIPTLRSFDFYRSWGTPKSSGGLSAQPPPASQRRTFLSSKTTTYTTSVLSFNQTPSLRMTFTICAKNFKINSSASHAECLKNSEKIFDKSGSHTFSILFIQLDVFSLFLFPQIHFQDNHLQSS